VPVRWWQAVEFVRLSFAVLRGCDPWADHVLSRPWAPASLIEYAYILLQFPTSSAYFLVASGKRVGVLWLISRADIAYMVNLGLLPGFRSHQSGMRIARLLITTMKFVEDYVGKRGLEALVLRMAGSNAASRRMATMFGCRSLGLATTTLTLDPAITGPPPPHGAFKPLSRRRAARRWKRFKLHAVERTSGPTGVKVATRFVELFDWVDAMPRGKALGLHRNGQEVGLALVCRRDGEINLHLLTDAAPLDALDTIALAGELAGYLNAPIRHLTVTLEHAKTITELEPYQLQRHRNEERHAMFQLAAWRPALRAKAEVNCTEKRPTPTRKEGDA
jgi:hypothetical protein